MAQLCDKKYIKSYCKILTIELFFLATSAVEVVKSSNVLLGDELNRSIKVRNYKYRGMFLLFVGIVFKAYSLNFWHI